MLRVRTWMTKNLVTLSPKSKRGRSLTLCRERRIRHIPIVEEGRLVGIVSDRDLRDASPAPGDAQISKHPAGETTQDVMTREVSTAVPQDPIENAAQEMYELKIGSLPGGGRGGPGEAVGDRHILRCDRGSGNSRWVARTRLQDRSPGAEQGEDPGRGFG